MSGDLQRVECSAIIASGQKCINPANWTWMGRPICGFHANKARKNDGNLKLVPVKQQSEKEQAA